jgi:hypothetical protein
VFNGTASRACDTRATRQICGPADNGTRLVIGVVKFVAPRGGTATDRTPNIRLASICANPVDGYSHHTVTTALPVVLPPPELRTATCTVSGLPGTNGVSGAIPGQR